MHILFLGTSNDRLPVAGGAVSRIERVEELLRGRLDDRVTITFRVAWPTEALPSVLEQWIARYEPDLVYISVNGYWYLHDSVPLRLRRRLGRAGRIVGGAATRAASAPRLSWNRAFRAVRAVAERTIGGETEFTPDQVVSSVEACIRVAVRREGLAVAVRPSWGDVPYARSLRGALAKEQVRLSVQAGIAEICRRHHVYCEVTPRAHWMTAADRVGDAGDDVHQGPRGLEFTAGLLADSIMAAVAWHRGEPPA